MTDKQTILITGATGNIGRGAAVALAKRERVMTVLFAEPPVVAGEPIAALMLSSRDRHEINGALFKLDKRVKKPDKAMNDEASRKRLWDELVRLTEAPAHEAQWLDGRN